MRTLVEECVHNFLMAYDNFGLIRFPTFSVLFIINARFYYLSLSAFTGFNVYILFVFVSFLV